MWTGCDYLFFLWKNYIFFKVFEQTHICINEQAHKLKFQKRDFVLTVVY